MTRTFRMTLATVATALALVAVLGLPEALAARLVFEETVIEGEVRKPEVTVYISQQNLNDKYRLELRESFLDRIVESVEHPPF